MLKRRKPLKQTPLKRSTKPIRARRSKPRRGRIIDSAYKAWIATLPCVIAGTRPVEVAHVGERGLGQKCSDRETLPLSVEFHREGPTAHHVLGKQFWAYHGLDRDRLIAEYNERYEREG